MTLDLPKPVVAYLAADRIDGDAVAACFTEHAVVKDEGHTYQGQAAIRQWKTDVSSRYQYTTEPLACEQSGGKFVVTSKVAGNFPGSPVVLRYFFGLEDNRIASLEVVP